MVGFEAVLGIRDMLVRIRIQTQFRIQLLSSMTLRMQKIIRCPNFIL